MGSAIPLVKREMRNLCILRLIHGFIQGLPLLFVQGFLLSIKSPFTSQVHSVSLALSFFGICWSLASFNKNVRSRDIEKLVLTWIGVIVQLLWRLGTVSSRILALVVYASAFEHWIILVVALHWLCMLLWNLAQSDEVLGESKKAKFGWSLVLSYVHTVAYINVEKKANTKLKMAAFYAVTFMENVLLVSLWTTSIRASLDFESEERRDIVMTVVLAFMGGLFFMLIYYRLFHTSKISTFGSNTSQADRSAENQNSKQSEKLDMNEYCNNQAVFNCVLNPALRKKKKMPSRLPPAPPEPTSNQGKMATPFWKQPLPEQTDDIRQKLQHKRQNQLKQLQLIENEIRSGHLKRHPQAGLMAPPILAPVHRDPGIHPYLNIHDPLNDSSGDQGKSGFDYLMSMA